MSDSVVTRGADALAARVSPQAAGIAALVVLAELALIAGYLGLTGTEPTSVRYLVYPFVWINAAMWAVTAVAPPSAPTRLRAVVGLVAVGYLLVLAYAGGVLGVSLSAHHHGGHHGLAVFTSLPPGWGPTVVYDHALVSVTLIPYQILGYLALAYLVYVALLDAATAALSGVVGLLTCVSCSWPVVAALLAGVAGGSTVAAVVYSFAVDISTAAFVTAVALLVWRPGTG